MKDLFSKDHKQGLKLVLKTKLNGRNKIVTDDGYPHMGCCNPKV